MNNKQFMKQLTKAVANGNIKKFKKFLSYCYMEDIIDLTTYGNFLRATKEEQKSIIFKITITIKSLPQTKKDKAKKWLNIHKVSINLS